MIRVIARRGDCGGCFWRGGAPHERVGEDHAPDVALKDRSRLAAQRAFTPGLRSGTPPAAYRWRTVISWYPAGCAGIGRINDLMGFAEPRVAMKWPPFESTGMSFGWRQSDAIASRPDRGLATGSSASLEPCTCGTRITCDELRANLAKAMMVDASWIYGPFSHADVHVSAGTSSRYLKMFLSRAGLESRGSISALGLRRDSVSSARSSAAGQRPARPGR
jgi:hypothetical protein